MAKIIAFPGGEDITPPKITNAVVDIGRSPVTVTEWASAHRIATNWPNGGKWFDALDWLNEIPYRGDAAGLDFSEIEKRVNATWEDWTADRDSRASLTPFADYLFTGKVKEPERRYYVWPKPEVTSKFDLSAFNLPPKANLPILKNTPEWAKDKRQREARQPRKMNHYLDFESYSRAAFTRPVYSDVLVIDRPLAYSGSYYLAAKVEEMMKLQRARMQATMDAMFVSFVLGACINPAFEPEVYAVEANPSHKPAWWMDRWIMPARDNIIKFPVLP